MLPCFFVCGVILCCGLHVWKNSHLSHSLQTDYVQEKTFTSLPSMRFGGPSNLFCGYILSGLMHINFQLDGFVCL